MDTAIQMNDFTKPDQCAYIASMTKDGLGASIKLLRQSTGYMVLRLGWNEKNLSGRNRLGNRQKERISAMHAQIEPVWRQALCDAGWKPFQNFGVEWWKQPES